MPHILLRFMAIEDENKLKLSRRVASVWVVIAMAMAVFIGIVGNALSKSGIIGSLAGADTETVIVRIADLLSSYGILPALMAGLILAGILASTMSTADSQLLAASSSVSQNILQDTLRLNLSAKTSMLIERGTVCALYLLLGQDSVRLLDRSSSVRCSGNGRLCQVRLLAWSQAALPYLYGNTSLRHWAVRLPFMSYSRHFL